MSAQGRRTDRTRSAKSEPPVILANTNQVSIAVSIDLNAADEKHIVRPIFDAVEAVAGIAVRFRPSYHAAVPSERRHRNCFEMRDVHPYSQEHQFHVGAVSKMSQAHR